MASRGLVALFFLGLVVLCNGAETCTFGQQYCDPTGTQVLFCGLGSTVIVLQNCSSSTACDNSTVTCQNKNSNITIPCEGTSLYPDPYDCHSSFICDNTVSGEFFNCSDSDPNAYGYDPLTGLCLYTKQDRVCTDKPFPPCTSVGQSGAQVENPNIYYFCVRDPVSQALVPWLAKCPMAYQLFDVSTHSCITRTVPTTTTTTTTIPTTTPTPTTTTPTTTNTLNTTTTLTTTPTTITTTTSTTTAAPQLPCPRPGSFAYPSNCTMYYVCTPNLQPIPFTCLSGYSYYPSVNSCVKGPCP